MKLLKTGTKNMKEITMNNNNNNNNQVALRPSFMPSVEEFSQISSLCQTLATAPHYSKLGGGGVLAIWLTAREMGLPPMLCLNGGMYTFSGAVSLSSHLINMLIEYAGHRVDVIELSDKICTLEFIRGDRKESEGKRYRHSFSIEDARVAGLLGKDNWRKFPKPMLYSRCLSGGGKIHMPSVLMGVYAHGEVGSMEINESELAEFEVSDCKPQETNKEQTPPVKPPIPPTGILTDQIRLDFIKKNDLLIRADGSMSEKLKYIKHIAKTKKKTEDALIDRACMNSKEFEDMFNNWNRENLVPKFPNLPQVDPIGLEIFSM